MHPVSSTRGRPRSRIADAGLRLTPSDKAPRALEIAVAEREAQTPRRGTRIGDGRALPLRRLRYRRRAAPSRPGTAARAELSADRRRVLRGDRAAPFGALGLRRRPRSDRAPERSL